MEVGAIQAKQLRSKQAFKKIRERVQTLNEARVEKLASEVEGSSGNRKVFEVARILTKSQDV